jgi:hypothetical protein
MRTTQRGAVATAACALGFAALTGGAANADVANAPATVVNVNGMSGTCETEYAAAGVGGSGGLDYKIQGYATSTSTSTTSTRVSCRLVRISDAKVIYSTTSNFMAANAAYLAKDFTLYDLGAFRTCIKSDYFTSGGSTITTGWKTTAGGAC